MYFPITYRLKRLYYRLRRITPAQMSMVKYWKKAEAVEAKMTTDKDGATILVMPGEKYPIKGFPRAHILFGLLSPLKHQIKNQIFNESWYELECGIPHELIIKNVKEKLSKILDEFLAPLHHDLMPPGKMCGPVREIHRALTVVAQENEIVLKIRDALCLILQEDDGYRFRVQWLTMWFPVIRLNPVKILDRSLYWLEQSEMVNDMKERIRLLRRILLVLLTDSSIKDLFIRFFKEVHWRKLKVTEADRYQLRPKYFKADFDKFSY